MDATTIIAVLSCAVVFFGWLVLPHAPATRMAAHEPSTARVPVSAA